MTKIGVESVFAEKAEKDSSPKISENKSENRASNRLGLRLELRRPGLNNFHLLIFSKYPELPRHSLVQEPTSLPESLTSQDSNGDSEALVSLVMEPGIVQCSNVQSTSKLYLPFQVLWCLLDYTPCPVRLILGVKIVSSNRHCKSSPIQQALQGTTAKF